MKKYAGVGRGAGGNTESGYSAADLTALLQAKEEEYQKQTSNHPHRKDSLQVAIAADAFPDETILLGKSPDDLPELHKALPRNARNPLLAEAQGRYRPPVVARAAETTPLLKAKKSRPPNQPSAASRIAYAMSYSRERTASKAKEVDAALAGQPPSSSAEIQSSAMSHSSTEGSSQGFFSCARRICNWLTTLPPPPCCR
jgi:hypothetical protein